MLAAVLVCAGSQVSGQITVTMGGEVGIGTTSPWAKLSVYNNDSNTYTMTVEDYNATGFKLGVYNYMYDPIGGSVYGIYNSSVNTNNNSFTYTNGHSNFTDGAIGYTTGLNNNTYQWEGGDYTGYGIYNYSYLGTKGEGYGIYNYLYNPSGGSIGDRWGIYNYVVPANTTNTIGIYSSTSGAGNYAGYFDGNVRIVGTLTVVSDETKKQNIQTLDHALDLVQQLKGHTYTFKADPNMNLPEGQQYGFLAQEVEDVLPNLVNTGENPNHPALKTATQGDMKPLKKGERPEQPTVEADLGSESIKSVNYIGVIPILVEAVKEQQALIERQQQQIRALEEKVGK